jgi:histidine ammonia-lyase
MHYFGTHPLTVDMALAIASGEIAAGLDAEALQRLASSAAHVQDIVHSNRTVYGVKTGFCILANTSIS